MKNSCHTSKESVQKSLTYADTILDSLSAHVAIIDAEGIILETNRAWKTFAEENDIQIRPDTLNVNYLEICEAATGPDATNSKIVAAGIRSVIAGEVEAFTTDYACHSPNEKRWFFMRASRAVGTGPMRIVISHENVTALKLAEERLRKREAELQQKTKTVEEANAALKAILRQRDEDRAEIETAILKNLETAVFPYLDRIKRMKQDKTSNRLIALAESGLKDLASPFLMRLSNASSLLTPQEIQVGNLIKQGKTSKEIADILNLSITTINFHRRNLRKKLGIKNQSVNLCAYLLSLKD